MNTDTETIAMWASTKTALIASIVLILLAVAAATFTNWDDRVPRVAPDALLNNYHVCNTYGEACVTVR